MGGNSASESVYVRNKRLIMHIKVYVRQLFRVLLSLVVTDTSTRAITSHVRCRWPRPLLAVASSHSSSSCPRRGRPWPPRNLLPRSIVRCLPRRDERYGNGNPCTALPHHRRLVRTESRRVALRLESHSLELLLFSHDEGVHVAGLGPPSGFMD